MLKTLLELLVKIRVSDPLILFIVFPANIIIVLALMATWYPQVIIPTLHSNNQFIIVTLGVLILIIATFFSAVELYFERGIIRRLSRREQEKEGRRTFQNLPPPCKHILRLLMSQPGCNLNVDNPVIASALSDLESLGLIQCDNRIPPTYHVSIEYYLFLHDHSELLQ